MDSYGMFYTPSGSSSRPQRAAAVKASGKITSQYAESKLPPSPPSPPLSVPPPPPKRPRRAQRSCKSQPRAIGNDDEPVPELAHDDTVLVALSPSQLNADMTCRPRGKPTTLPVAALLTPSTEFLRKRKSLTDVDGGVPFPRTEYNDRYLNPRSGEERLDNEGHWEKRVREALQDLDLPRFETGSERPVPTTIMSESEGDPLSFVYDKLQVQPGRNYQVEIVEIRALCSPENKRHQALAWELRGRQGNDIRAFLRLNRTGFILDEVTAICGKLVDALNRWPDLNAIFKFKGAYVPGRGSLLI
ncbi:hypothetical protein BGZ61DRAFT_475564 [Ilyonectria robusta]|uniref:uncharacterized protein n=1 Tax=Ilyonectria robusta TaxID=1079257 RepID=UPI001E8CA261|nr:uncharacterized protein BGZ61DRAFT_475564 [Ilyonectria robusta]KAH8721596.1 hypothetical protein BGZ61DRAFT_475564 [Ilyonectria robusta]